MRASTCSISPIQAQTLGEVAGLAWDQTAEVNSGRFGSVKQHLVASAARFDDDPGCLLRAGGR